MAQVLAMKSMAASAVAGRLTSSTRPAARPRATLVMAHGRGGTGGARRPFYQQQRQRGSACRPVNYVGGRWGASGPVGFGCGTTASAEDISRMAQDFEKAMFGGRSGGRHEGDRQMWFPTDLAESVEAFTFTADLPGVQRADTKVQANKKEGTLTISGERTAGAVPDDQKDMRRRSERRFGKFMRTFKLPEDADVGAITATFKDGVLTISVARSQPAEPQVLDIPVDDWLAGGAQDA